jgi:hypothetical protein
MLLFVFSAWYALYFSVTEVAFVALLVLLLFWMLGFFGNASGEVLVVDTDRKEEVSPARSFVQACCENKIGRTVIVLRSRHARRRNVEHERLVALQASNLVKRRKDVMGYIMLASFTSCCCLV